VTQTNPGSAEIELYGIMCDGTVVMGCTELDGSIPTFSDLDAQGGHVHDLIDETGATLLANRYHTHICYSSVSDENTYGNGYPQHEFTPESSYYVSTGTSNNNVCGYRTSPIEADGELYIISNMKPDHMGLMNYPNPFNPITSITYSLDESMDVDIAVYNLSGAKVETLINKFQNIGNYSINWDASLYPSGIYFVKMIADEYLNTQKLMLVK
jgi:hypothetical protein